MSRPLLRGVSSGGRISGRDSWDSQMKVRNEKEDIIRSHSPRSLPSFLSRILASLFFHDGHPSKINSPENGFGSDSTNSSALRSRQNITLHLLKFSLALILILTLSGSFWWTISISTSSRGNIFRGYRRLQEQLITDLTDIGVLSRGLAKLKEVEYCPEEHENYVPCFNISENLASGYSEGNEYERRCHYGSAKYCSVLPPKNYRIPLRWPTGRDFIWIENVRITAQEVLYSGSLTKRSVLIFLI